MLDAMRRKFVLFARQQGKWHSEMERFSGAEISWAEDKEQSWSPEYSEWWAERRIWHGRRRRFWEFFGGSEISHAGEIKVFPFTSQNKSILIHKLAARHRPYS